MTTTERPPPDEEAPDEEAPNEEALRALGAWLVQESLYGCPIDRLFEGLCEGLEALGVPVMRAHIAFGFLHPMVDSMSITWSRHTGLTRERYPRGEVSDLWLNSPPKALMDSGEKAQRYRLEEGEGVEQFAQLRDLRDQGASDYLLMLAAFGEQKASLEKRDGMFTSWTSDAPGGFTKADRAVFDRLMPRLALAVKSAVREETSRNVLSAYLGAGAGQKVLDGQIQLGDGDTISAILWYSDMRNSTPIAEAIGQQAFLEHLNRYFACTAGAVLDHGGEVLRFIGDAVLAIFPTDGPGGEERAARMAVSAARDSRARMKQANAEKAEGAPDIKFGLALHVGEVLYGNIGVPERVEFSVIGAAANEVARLEGFTKELDRPILASDAFHALAPASLGHWDSLGPQSFRGVRRPQTVWALAAGD